MKRTLSLLLVCSLFFAPSVFAEEGIDPSTSTFKEANENTFIEYDIETQEKTENSIENSTGLSNYKFTSSGKDGVGEPEKIDPSDFIDSSKTKIDPLTGEELGEAISPFAIIGSDNRNKVQNTSIMPFRAQTYIQFENLTNGWSCSGGVIADDLVVTNAHCVDRQVLRATVLPGVKDSSMAYGFYRVTNISYPAEYSNSGSSAYDYAILRVAPDENGNDIGDRAGVLSFTEAGNISSGSLLKTYGYPGDKMNETGSISLWGMEGHSDSFTDSALLFYNMDTAPGQSGSPVLNTSNRMVAVHNAAYTLNPNSPSERDINGGPKIRSDFISLFNSMNN